MNILLVTSEVTFMPLNYSSLIKNTIKSNIEDIKGLLLIENLNLNTIKSTFGLRYVGAKNISNQLFKNMLSLRNDERVKVCQEYNIPILKSKSVNSSKVKEWLKTNKIDLILNLRTRCIYKKDVLKIPNIGCYNIHHGVLPKYRGTMCDLFALSEGRNPGFSIHKMTTKIDAGDIFETHEIEYKGKNYFEYLSKTQTHEISAVNRFIAKIKKNKNEITMIKNICINPVMTKTPNLSQVKTLIKKGMIL